jgi:hypothetical protein
MPERLKRAKVHTVGTIWAHGLSIKLDSRGNAKATELVGKTGKKSAYEVAVTGGMSKHTIQVESMPLAK